jgi:hypothetical protein
MGRRPGSHHQSRALAALLALAVALALSGCANSAWRVAGPSAPPPPVGGSASVSGTSSLGALFALGLVGFFTAGGTPFYAMPEMNPDRRVVEQDCSKPLEDPGANLRCR